MLLLIGLTLLLQPGCFCVAFVSMMLVISKPDKKPYKVCRVIKFLSVNKPYIMWTNNMYYFPTYSFWRKRRCCHSYHAYTYVASYMIVFSLITCTIFLLTYIARFWRKGRDSHSYHAYTSLYDCIHLFFLTATLLLCMNCCL